MALLEEEEPVPSEDEPAGWPASGARTHSPEEHHRPVPQVPSAPQAHASVPGAQGSASVDEVAGSHAAAASAEIPAVSAKPRVEVLQDPRPAHREHPEGDTVSP